MSIIEPELTALKDNLLDMIKLVIGQVDKCKDVVEKIDVKLAEEIIEGEKKINNQELSIDRDCENVLALHTPVAVDLRFVLSALRMSNDLERIGDNTNNLAKFVKQNSKDINKKLLDEFKLTEMLEVLSSMLSGMKQALKEENTALAKETLKKDELFDQFGKKALKAAEEVLKNEVANAKAVLKLFSLVRGLERSGALAKNIGEEIVFYIDSEILKHTKKE